MIQQEWRNFTIIINGRISNDPVSEFDKDGFKEVDEKVMHDELSRLFEKVDLEWGIEVKEQTVKVEHK